MSEYKKGDSSAVDTDLLQIEQSYWETYQDYDWSSDATKEKAISYIPRLDGDILELCIGGGAFARKIPPKYKSYTGLDLSRTLLKALNENLPNIKSVYGDAQALPFDDDSFDVVLLFSGLHHLPKMHEAMKEAHRVLRADGVYYCFEPNDRAWYRMPMRFMRNQKVIRDFIEIYSEDEVYLDPENVSEIARDVGFEDVDVKYLTARFNPNFLGFFNKIFARLMYAAGSLGRGVNTQSYFAFSARKP